MTNANTDVEVTGSNIANLGIFSNATRNNFSASRILVLCDLLSPLWTRSQTVMNKESFSKIRRWSRSESVELDINKCYGLRSSAFWTTSSIYSHNYLSNTTGGVQASASQPPDPHWKPFLIVILQVERCVSLHPLGGAEHITTSFLNPCRGSVYIFFFLFFSLSI